MSVRDAKSVEIVNADGTRTRGLYRRPCGSYSVKSGAVCKTLPDYEYAADFTINGQRFRTVLCRESEYAAETDYDTKTRQWINPAMSHAITKLAEYRANAKKGAGPTGREAERCQDQQRRKANVAREERAAKRNKTVADLIKKYDPHIEAKAKPSSYATFKSHMARIEADLGSILLRELTLEKVEEWQTELKKAPRIPRKKKPVPSRKTRKPAATLAPAPPAPLSVLTVNRHIQTLKAMMTKACDWGWINERRLREIRKIKLGNEKDRQRKDFLSREEAERLIDAADQVIRPVIICALQTGMRKSEVLGLRWRYVDLQHRLIHLPKTKSDEPRSLPINDRLLATLKDKNLIRSLKDDHVFLNPETGKRWSDLKRQFSRAVTKAKLAHKDIVFHHLRHTAASWLVMEGVPLLTVARILGHADLQMVSRYSHLSPEHLDKALAVLGGETSQKDMQPVVTNQ